MIPKTLQAIQADPRVDDIVDERDTGDGYWVYLKPGWYNPVDGLTMIHEWNVRDVLAKYRQIKPAPDGI